MECPTDKLAYGKEKQMYSEKKNTCTSQIGFIHTHNIYPDTFEKQYIS